MSFLKVISSPYKHCFGQLDQEFLKKLILSVTSMYSVSQGKFCFVQKQCLRCALVITLLYLYLHLSDSALPGGLGGLAKRKEFSKQVDIFTSGVVPEGRGVGFQKKQIAAPYWKTRTNLGGWQRNREPLHFLKVKGLPVLREVPAQIWHAIVPLS